MAKYHIDITETYRAHLVVEADNEEDTKNLFEHWIERHDYEYNTKFLEYADSDMEITQADEKETADITSSTVYN